MWFLNGKKQQTITRIIDANPEWIKTYEKKKTICFVCILTLLTNQQDTFVVILDPLDGELHIFHPSN